MENISSDSGKITPIKVSTDSVCPQIVLAGNFSNDSKYDDLAYFGKCESQGEKC